MSAPVFSADDGFALGIDMLREISALNKRGLPHCPCSVEAGSRQPGEPQRNVVAEHLERVRAANCAELERGFAAFLTDYLASCAAGFVPDAEKYEQLLETEAI